MISENLAYFALHTEPRSEFAIESHLRREGFKAFCPTETKTKRVSRYSKRTRDATYPQLPGYVVLGAPSELHTARNWSEPLYLGAEDPSWTEKEREHRTSIRHYARRSGRVRKVLADNGRARKLTPAEIRRIEMTSAHTVPNSISVNTHRAVHRGMDVEVLDGAYRDWIVKVQDIDGDFIKTTVLMFRKPHPVHIPIAWVRPA